MIDYKNYSNHDAVFVRQGGGLWRIFSSCSVPSVTLVNDATGERVDFGLGGTLAEEFEEVEGLKFDHCIRAITKA